MKTRPRLTFLSSTSTKCDRLEPKQVLHVTNKGEEGFLPIASFFIAVDGLEHVLSHIFSILIKAFSLKESRRRDLVSCTMETPTRPYIVQCLKCYYSTVSRNDARLFT